MIKNQDLTGFASIDNPQNQGYSFWAKHPIIPNMSIYNALKAINLMYQKKVAIDCLEIEVTYNQLFKDAITISRALKELGVRKGQIVSISMPNFYQAVAAFLACNRIGAVTTFLDPNASKKEIYSYLNIFESPIYINYNATEEENIKCKKETGVEYIITLSNKNINNLSLDNDYRITTNKNIIDFNSLGSIAEYQKKGLPSNSSKDDSLILFTSGSTGKPKPVVLTNKNVIAAGVYLKNSSKVESLNGERTLVCVPFTYPYGFATSTLMTLLSSKTAILAPNLSKDNISQYLKKNPNIIFGSPALLNLMIRYTPEKQDLSSITTYISGGDFLTPKHSKRGSEFFEAHQAHNVEIGNGSGNAETVSCGTNPTGIEIRPETAGKVLVGTNAMIVDPETLEEKKYNEEGLLCVSGEHVFKEYYGMPEETKKAKFEKNGKTYFKTGTLGFIDKDGYFTLTGRDSRFYIMSSLNKVYCDKIQTLLSYIDIINECAVVKVPDEELLYVNKAYIVLKDGIAPTEETKEYIMKIIKDGINTINKGNIQLKSYEIPAYLEFVENLPRRQGTDKINYEELEKDAEEKRAASKLVKKL